MCFLRVLEEINAKTNSIGWDNTEPSGPKYDQIDPGLPRPETFIYASAPLMLRRNKCLLRRPGPGRKSRPSFQKSMFKQHIWKALNSVKSSKITDFWWNRKGIPFVLSIPGPEKQLDSPGFSKRILFSSSKMCSRDHDPVCGHGFSKSTKRI